MTSLATTSLSPTERRVLEQFVRLLEAELGPDLRALWLYGSRARGEQPGPDSDVDLLVISTRRGSQDDLRVIELLMDAAGGRRGESGVLLREALRSRSRR